MPQIQKGNLKKYLIFAAIILLFYGMTLTYYFSLDDVYWIKNMNAILNGQNINYKLKNIVLSRPLFGIVFFVYYKLFKLNAFPYHLISIILYFLCSILLYNVLKKILKISEENAFLSTIIFILLSSNYELVVWISAQAYLIAAAFILYSILQFDEFLIKGNNIALTKIIIASILATYFLQVGIIIIPTLILYALTIRKKETMQNNKNKIIVTTLIYVLFVILIFLKGGILSVHGASIGNLNFAILKIEKNAPNLRLLTIHLLIFLLIILVILLIFGSPTERFAGSLVILFIMLEIYVILSYFSPFMPYGAISYWRELYEVFKKMIGRLSFFASLFLAMLIGLQLEKFPKSKTMVKRIIAVILIAFLASSTYYVIKQEYFLWKNEEAVTINKFITTYYQDRKNLTIYFNNNSTNTQILTDCKAYTTYRQDCEAIYEVIACFSALALNTENITAYGTNAEELAKIPVTENEIVFNISSGLCPLQFTYWPRKDNYS
jgi:hypothetical protein